MRYDRSSIKSTISTAIKSATENKSDRYVYATALGYTITNKPTGIRQAHYSISASGGITLATPGQGGAWLFLSKTQPA